MSEDLSIRKILIKKQYGGTRLISEKTKAFYAEFNERVEAATSSYSTPGDFSQREAEQIYNYPKGEILSLLNI